MAQRVLPVLYRSSTLGPAYRATAFTDGRDERSVAGRGTIDLDWRLNDGLTFRQDAAAYYDSFNSTLTSTSALAAKVLGPISAQLSHYIHDLRSVEEISRIDGVRF